MSRVAAALLAALALAACGREPPPSPPQNRPALERPVVTLADPVAAHEVLRIPRAALVERSGLSGVFVLSDKGEARFHLVKPGRTRGEHIEIVSGLRGSETLVLGDLRAVHDGTPIKATGPADQRR